MSHFKDHIDFRANKLIGRIPDSWVQSLYQDVISIETRIEYNRAGIRCSDWVVVEDECFTDGDWGTVNCQVKHNTSDRRSSEVRDYVRNTLMIDIPHSIPVTEAMSVVYDDCRWKIISVINDLNIATRLVVELREE